MYFAQQSPQDRDGFWNQVLDTWKDLAEDLDFFLLSCGLHVITKLSKMLVAYGQDNRFTDMYLFFCSPLFLLRKKMLTSKCKFIFLQARTRLFSNSQLMGTNYSNFFLYCLNDSCRALKNNFT